MGDWINILMKKSTTILISIITWGLVQFSCDSGPDFLKSSGDPVEVERNLDSFNSISAIDEVDIYISQGPEQRVSIHAGKNIEPKIELTVKDNVLEIYNKNTFNWLREPGNPEIHITIPDIRKLELFDYVNIYALDTLKTSYLRVYTYGTGSVSLLLKAETVSLQSDFISVIEVKGEATDLKLKNISDGKILTRDLIAQNIKVEHTGSNLIEVFPIESLSGTMTGTGDVIYFNKPPLLDVKATGTGRVYEAN